MAFQEDELDELETAFTSDGYSIINEVRECLIESGYDYKVYEEAIDDWYKEKMTFSYNKIRNHFVYFCLYKILGNAEKALDQVKESLQLYLRNTVSYQWESVVYDALIMIPGFDIVPDCVLPNNKKPDLVINPIYPEVRYHPRGTKILSADMIIDIKTTIYDLSKELKYYRKYCNGLTIIYLYGDKSPNKDIKCISSDELIEMLKDNGTEKAEKLIYKIKILQKKSTLEHHLKDFEGRYKVKSFES